MENLKSLTTLSAPGDPFERPGGAWVQQELVQIDHAQVCLLCHAPSRTGTFPRRYYDRRRSEPWEDVGLFAVLVRQGFSLLHEEKGKDGKVKVVRHDYLVRERPLTVVEGDRHTSKLAGTKAIAADAQRRAVAWAIRELSKAK